MNDRTQNLHHEGAKAAWRTWVSAQLTLAERSRIFAASGKSPGHRGQGLGAFASAAILAFDALPRAVQARAILKHRPAKSAGLDVLSFAIHPMFAAKLRGWRFPAIGQGHVLRAALLELVDRAPEFIADWKDEAFVFLCTHTPQMQEAAS